MEDQKQASPPISTETPVKKEPTINGPVAGGSFVILIAIMYILPQILMIAMPSFFLTNQIPHLMDGIIGFIAILIGLMIGLKVRKNAFLNGLFTGILTVGVAQITIIPSSRMGMESILQYSLIVGLPVIIGALIGGAIRKSKAQ